MGLLLMFKQPMSTAPSSEDTFKPFIASGPQFNILRTLVKNNADDDTIATYLGTLSSLQATSYRDEKHQEIRCYREEKLKEIGCYREEILRLQGELKTTQALYSGEVKLLTKRLQYTMAQYLRQLGMLSMRGIMEYIQCTMLHPTDVMWVSSQAQACWQAYVDQRPSLQECLLKRRLAVDNVGQDLADVYKTLSEDIHGSQTPTLYQKYDSVLYIGAPLVQKQRELIACLCEDVHVAYQVMPIAPVVGPNEA
ncbi:hypothetical protein CHLRE_07g325757v5 [Chlamydomonas reinhardtii]|uniref:Uncharacterized protein n=1 Tax=Chlamydomonas reinhardtii TaxID=3055 RepID=A0A2K3DJH7_CHLRE|nr:uncharacterized protein CHLRE_07g325757v5 [Chlamydomonas reinhardtii]PNW80682.1 hypothetical protein CHLRE_07g325757v5 [Chlamydomonas reinhardtii]